MTSVAAANLAMSRPVTLADFLRIANVILGLIDLAFTAPALVHAASNQVRLRLVGLAFVVVGAAVVGSVSRYGQPLSPALPMVTAGLALLVVALPPRRSRK